MSSMIIRSDAVRKVSGVRHQHMLGIRSIAFDQHSGLNDGHWLNGKVRRRRNYFDPAAIFILKSNPYVLIVALVLPLRLDVNALAFANHL